MCKEIVNNVIDIINLPIFPLYKRVLTVMSHIDTAMCPELPAAVRYVWYRLVACQQTCMLVYDNMSVTCA